MQLDGVFADSNANQVATKGSEDLDKDAFMQLLVTQLKNQDPLEPKGGEELSAQLASFSSLEQMEQMNENLTTMVLLQQSNALLSQLSESSALIGQEVNWSDSELGTSGSGTVESVRLNEGVTFLSVDGQDIPLFAVTDVLGTASPSTDVEGDEPAEPAEDGESDTSDESDDTN